MDDSQKGVVTLIVCFALLYALDQDRKCRRNILDRLESQLAVMEKEPGPKEDITPQFSYESQIKLQRMDRFFRENLESPYDMELFQEYMDAIKPIPVVGMTNWDHLNTIKNVYYLFYEQVTRSSDHQVLTSKYWTEIWVMLRRNKQEIY